MTEDRSALNAIGTRTLTRTARPCTRAGRKTASRTTFSAGSSKAGLELETTRGEPGSIRPSVSITLKGVTIS